MTLISQLAQTGHRLNGVSSDPTIVRGAFGGFPSGVAALCASIDGLPVGMVASSFTVGVSYSPPMVMFSVQNSSATWPLLSRAARIGVSILGHDQADTCLQLASRGGDRFVGLDVTVSEHGSVLLDDAVMWMECSVVAETPAGDHHIVVLEVHELSVDVERKPLVYQHRSFHSLNAVLKTAG